MFTFLNTCWEQTKPVGASTTADQRNQTTAAMIALEGVDSNPRFSSWIASKMYVTIVQIPVNIHVQLVQQVQMSLIPLFPLAYFVQTFMVPRWWFRVSSQG